MGVCLTRASLFLSTPCLNTKPVRLRLELEEGERVRVNMRPRVDEFLMRISDEFDTYAFTAATEVGGWIGS